MSRIKNLILIVLLLLFCPCVRASSYEDLMNSIPPPDFQLVKNIDPYQHEDYYNYAWAPYPLYRTSLTMKYSNGVIQAGYYLLVPRQINGRYYVFFKENGNVAHIVPVYQTEAVAESFYENEMPQPERDKWAKFCERTKSKFFNRFKDSKRISPPKSYIESTILQQNYMELILYYGTTKYYMIFKIRN